MLKGINLTLMIGPAVPIPAPQSVIDALTSVQVNSSTDRSGFQLTFTVSKRSPLLTTMLPAGYFDPIVTRIIIVVTLGGLPNVLMDGVITRQELSPSSEPGQSTLTVTGEDLSILMDLVEMPFMRYPAMPDVARINLILTKYLVFGIVPVVIPPIIMDIPSPTDTIPTHTGTDLQYIRRLASDCGYVFYVEPGPAPATSIAYFGPDVRIPVPQPALNVNMDAETNVESLSISLDGLAKKVFVITVFDPVTGRVPIPIPIPNISVLRPPLGARLTPPAKVEFPSDFANLSPMAAAKRALGISFAAADAISSSGSLDVLRYGRILRSRQLVGVRGAGITYDGLYYVNSVTHSIKRGEYKQNFNLSRDGLISLTPRVLP
ncbi:hypothetical protein [Calothrix sp. PCC 7507]|uniref:hypothetical protein n=1 Tax=Calothrix sp. PCC 7507 TaxID=99598 RepID=UPI00029F0F74|nr:hypothetical protein [Calothrix sp. PCC 7507]AFY34124.1 hypothetical protein Cal7507_3733 [Calothrix sp. PCC 7507]